MMKKILVTGSEGFIGRNFCERIGRDNKFEIIHFTKKNTENDLYRAIKEADLIFHFAGVNRPQDENEFVTGNIDLTKKIVSFIKTLKMQTPIVMTSSVQASNNTLYGQSKKEAENIILNFCKNNDSDCYIYRLANVFGKWCRPNYNSAVATFCYNIAREIEININDPVAEVKLVYIDDVIDSLISLVDRKNESLFIGFVEAGPEYIKTVKYIADTLVSFECMRHRGLIFDLSDSFSKKLYTTYLSYLPTDKFSCYIEKNCDNRGWLFEFLKSDTFGQIFISTTNPGITRGNHFHNNKVEKFCVIKGKGIIRFRDIRHNDVIEYNVNDEQVSIVDIPPGYTHSIENTGDENMITMFWANEIFNVVNSDTYFSKVLP